MCWPILRLLLAGLLIWNWTKDSLYYLITKISWLSRCSLVMLLWLFFFHIIQTICWFLLGKFHCLNFFGVLPFKYCSWVLFINWVCDLLMLLWQYCLLFWISFLTDFFVFPYIPEIKKDLDNLKTAFQDTERDPPWKKSSHFPSKILIIIC